MKRFDLKMVSLLTLPVLALSALAFWSKNQTNEMQLSMEKNEFTKDGTHKIRGHNNLGFFWRFENGNDELKACEPKPSQCVDKASGRTFYPKPDASNGLMISDRTFGHFSREDAYDTSILEKQKGPLIFKVEVSCSTVQGKRTQSQWITLEVEPKTIKSH